MTIASERRYRNERVVARMFGAERIEHRTGKFRSEEVVVFG